MATWYTVPIVMPTDTQEVYCRPYSWYGEPFLATYSTANKEFTANNNGLVYPAYVIRRWRTLN